MIDCSVYHDGVKDVKVKKQKRAKEIKIVIDKIDLVRLGIRKFMFHSVFIHLEVNGAL